MTAPEPPVWGGKMSRARREQLVSVIDMLRAYGAPQVPLYEAALRGEVMLCTINDRRSLPDLHRIGQPRLPAIITIGDDDYKTSGASGWACSDVVMAWARAVGVHGTGGRPEHYVSAVRVARSCRRFVLVETAAVATLDWGIAARDAGVKQVEVLRPPPGGRHPVDASPHALVGTTTTLFLPDGTIHEL